MSAEDDLFEVLPVAELSAQPALMRVTADTARTLLRTGKAVLVNPARDLPRLDMGSGAPLKAGPRQMLFTRASQPFNPREV